MKQKFQIISILFIFTVLSICQVYAFDLVIKNGTIVTSKKSFKADIAIENEKIVKIAQAINPNGAKVVDAKGKMVLPGVIDAHVHFNLSFCGTNSQDWDDATKAAACGGVTTVIDYAIQQKGSTLKKAIESRKEDADGKVVIDYALHGGITDWNDTTQKEMRYYTANGIPTFKMFMIYKSAGWMADDATICSALEETKRSGGTLMLHAESSRILEVMIKKYHTPEMMKKYGASCHTLSRPGITEFEAIQRAVTLAEKTKGRLYIVHVSTAKGSQLIKQSNSEGNKIWGETCAQYLMLTDEVFNRKDGHHFATCPQVKSYRDRTVLTANIMNGGLSVLSTDDCTFNTKQKAMWNGDFTKIPFGMPGVETLLPTMYDKLVVKHNMPLPKLVALLSTNPAKLFGLYPKKGAIQVGSDADIVIFDCEKTRTISHKMLTTKCDWSPYEGFKIKGTPELTISRGKIVAKNGKFVGQEGYGRFVPGKPKGKLEIPQLD